MCQNQGVEDVKLVLKLFENLLTNGVKVVLKVNRPYWVLTREKVAFIIIMILLL